jgi:hypothetical protein
MHSVVVTLPGARVAVVHPSPRCVLALMEGGGLYIAAEGRPGLRKWLNAIGLRFRFPLLPTALAKEWEVHKLLRSEWRRDLTEEARADLAWRWINGLADGGLTEEAAVLLIGEKDRPYGSMAMELIDPADLPDRHYRTAWRRSTNGGPVWVDDVERICIDENFLWSTYDDQHAEPAAALRRHPSMVGPQLQPREREPDRADGWQLSR